MIDDNVLAAFITVTHPLRCWLILHCKTKLFLLSVCVICVADECHLPMGRSNFLIPINWPFIVVWLCTTFPTTLRRARGRMLRVDTRRNRCVSCCPWLAILPDTPNMPVGRAPGVRLHTACTEWKTVNFSAYSDVRQMPRSNDTVDMANFVMIIKRRYVFYVYTVHSTYSVRHLSLNGYG
jgi:hypothetical protein